MKVYSIILIILLLGLAVVSVYQNIFEVTPDQNHSNTNGDSWLTQTHTHTSQTIHISCTPSPCIDPTLQNSTLSV